MAKNFGKQAAKNAAFSSLLGEESKTERAEEAAAMEEPKAEVTVTPTEREELLNSVSDEELRRRLQARQVKDRGKRKEVSSTEGFVRATFIIKKEQLEKIKLLCLRETLQQKEVLAALLSVGLKHYEEQYGELKGIAAQAAENENLKKFENL